MISSRKSGTVIFQSTPSARRATSMHWCRNSGMPRFQSTPSARRATNPRKDLQPGDPISIHALREEGDVTMRLPMLPRVYFNPRPPRGGRLKAFLKEKPIFLFQSTPSARRATRLPRRSCRLFLFQSTPSASWATQECRLTNLHTQISIHALREEGDSKSGEKIHHVCSIIHTCAQFEKELYEGSGEMQNKSC